MSEHNIVLMVDEDKEFASIVEMKLKSKGFDVRLAYEPAMGSRMIEELRPALVLLDINLPGTNGIDFLAELRKHVDLKDIKVAFFSSLVNPWTDFVDAKEAVKELGAVSFIDKAIDLDSLAQEVKEIIEAPDTSEGRV